MASTKALTRRNRLVGYAFLLPNFIGFLLFVFIPIIASLVISFTNWDAFNPPEFIGLANYARLLQDKVFHVSLLNNLYYTAISIPATLVLALTVAMVLNKALKGVRIFRAAFFIPNVTNIIAIAIVWQLLLHPTIGPINGFLRAIGIADPPRWFASRDWAMLGVILVSVWQKAGYFMVIYLAGLQGIPQFMYEAADIDGASGWQKFIHVTLPMLSPVIFFTSVIAIIHSFKVFAQIFALTEGGPGYATNVLVYQIYVEGFKKYDFGYASAMAYVLFAIISVVTLIQFRGQKRWVNY